MQILRKNGSILRAFAEKPKAFFRIKKICHENCTNGHGKSQTLHQSEPKPSCATKTKVIGFKRIIKRIKLKCPNSNKKPANDREISTFQDNNKFDIENCNSLPKNEKCLMNLYSTNTQNFDTSTVVNTDTYDEKNEHIQNYENLQQKINIYNIINNNQKEKDSLQ